MADAYWRYSESARHPAAMPPPAAVPMKRPRPDYPDMPAGPEMHGYYGDDGRGAGQHAIRDTDSINASYDRFLRNGNPYGPGENVRPLGGMPGRPVEDLRMLGAGDGRNVGVGGGRPELLPPDASNTVFVEGLPANCTRREVSRILFLNGCIITSVHLLLSCFVCPLLLHADIFRPFVGFREVRLVNKESRNPGGDPLVLCFVDFESPSQAAVALEALQGYVFDQHDRESTNLRLQFARYPGPRSGGGSGPRSGGGYGSKSGGGPRARR